LKQAIAKQNMLTNSITLNAVSREKCPKAPSFGSYFRMPLQPSALSFSAIKTDSAETTKIPKKIHANLCAVWRRGRPFMER
jgi:hypothetical protein